jgi:hypothetical protein
MQAQGCWVNGNQIIDVTFISHIDYLYDHPEDFGFSRQEVDETFQRHREKLGEEGSAREELIKSATKRGWIRVRHYRSPRDYWSVQFDKIEERKEAIVSFLRAMIEQGKMSKSDELRLIGFSDGFEKIYSFQEGGVGRFLEEQAEKQEGISSAFTLLPCPRCGSNSTEPVVVPMGFYRQCYNCGNVWDTRDV